MQQNDLRDTMIHLDKLEQQKKESQQSGGKSKLYVDQMSNNVVVDDFIQALESSKDAVIGSTGTKWEWTDVRKRKTVHPFNIGKLQAIAGLAAKYPHSNHFFHVSQQLEKGGFDFFRDVRGDGNCFYRSVAVGFISNLAMRRQHQSLTELAAMYLN